MTAASRIVLIQPQAEGAGAQEIARLLDRGLQARGHAVHHLFFFRRTAAFDRLPNAIFCAHERPTGPWSLVRMLMSLFGHLRRLRPDAALCFQHYGSLVGAPIARAAGVGVVIANRNSARELMPAWLRLADRWLGTLGLFARVVANSRNVAEEFADHPQAYRRRLVRIDHGFECKTSGLDRTAARAQFDLPAAAVLLGSVARLHALKNLAAAIRLLPFDPRWHLAIAGQGPERAALAALARSLGCADRLHFLGELAPEQVATLLRALDVFVFPSLAETFGLAAVEAAQAGVPVVANRLDVLEEVLSVDGAPCALFADAGDDDAFAAAVRRLLDDAPLAAALSARGAKLAARYSLDAMIDAYAAMIESELGSRASRGHSRLEAVRSSAP
jgi:glycosyltransferase involved in cell wall biosynthesis